MIPDNIEIALTFDDLLLVPSASEVLPNEVSLQTKLTEKIHLNCPLISAAMDTVTDSSTAITMAREGGIGIIHKNIKRQIRAVEDHAFIRIVTIVIVPIDDRGRFPRS